MKNILKNIAHNLGVVIIAVIVAFLLYSLDETLVLPNFQSVWTSAVGGSFLLIGIVFRVWASFTFYENSLIVMEVWPQGKIMSNGPYRISRNPFYVGIVGITFGVMLIAGSFSGIVLSILLFLFWDLFLRFFEEKQLDKAFGEEYRQYKEEVPRWIGWKEGMF